MIYFLKISSAILFKFNRFKQGLEITSTESRVIATLNDFNEKSWSVLDWLCKDLKQVAFFIVINQNVKLFQGVHVFSNFDG